VTGRRGEATKVGSNDIEATPVTQRQSLDVFAERFIGRTID
jgi:hypothetical protein